ncbi:Rne/Rng family ribonuclease [Sphingomonas sp. RP10(2022)]|uniref:Ribonuclease E n=1 Tax=Sphingomonas liriopis TaxID=2949094 RepID=A0A9X2KQE6_9SPHN|nr:ribonuclease E/G [Sphingomonas liriopis]MCP3735669.1 Rne/Rng family ribonuclease [Sphingomonas liriopis]
MLIDARHREETRVAVVKNNRIEEFDFESAERKQLKGNIYLAKVTRVEPSLQAAFVDYGGNRHGFLAFSEIHPDYYQIPKEDRDALLREEAEHAAEEAALRAEHDADDDDHEGDDHGDDDHDDFDDADHHDDGEHDEGEGAAEGTSKKPRTANDEEVEALRQRRMNLRRRYKIQDVIRRRQVLLVQVVKEERGNKGAALTTYLSLAGRYCVLMPNTSHGGGISRKISNASDRKRLKSIMADMQLPPSMGCIVRTAGLQRTKVEIKRDFDYLARLWDGIREATLGSAAPALIYGDSDLIKRAIRDIYNKDIDEVIVEGEDGYRHAKEFMKLLMPSHGRRIKQYADAVPLFQRAHVEDQLAAMYHPVVQLKSGGYLVINPTEALVSIDINSGRSTREHNIEQTATATNLEAAQEIARQLRLRDMAGLVVIDFIDMDNNSNVRKVEKAMKEALKDDRARIQVGRISSFGLMEMSRQRLRTGVLEASTRACPHCEGTGLVRTASSAGLSALRLIEDEAARGRGSLLTLRASQEATIYVLNRKRADIAEIEDRYGVQVEILPDREEEGARMSVEASGPPPAHPPKIEALLEEEYDDVSEDIEDEEDEEEIAEASEEEPRRESRPREERGEGDREGRGRGRRRRRGRRNRNREDENGNVVQDETDRDDAGQDEPEQDGTERDEAHAEDADAGAEPQANEDAEFAGEQPQGEGRRRRGRRGRRGGRRQAEGTQAEGASEPQDDDADTASIEREPIAEAGDAGPVTTGLDAPAPTAVEDADPVEAPKTRRRPRARSAAPVVEASAEAAPVAETPAVEPLVEEPAAKPKRTRKKAAPAAAEPVSEVPAAEAPAEAPAAEEKPKPRRRTRKAAVATDAAPADTIEAPAAAEQAPQPVPVPAPASTEDDDAAPTAGGDGETPRRGWWQRTFGA